MDLSLTETQEEFKKVAEGFVKAEVPAHQMTQWYKNKQTFRPELIKKAAEIGWLGMMLPEEYGGAGSTIFNAILAIEELARVDASVSVFVDVHNTLVTNAMIRWGSDEQKKKYLPKLATGEFVGEAVVHVAMVGLGTGSVACYAQKGQRLTFYEIDRLVRDVAFNPRYFTYAADARDRAVSVRLEMGDARIRLETVKRERPQERYDVILVDAFSSDAIPVHLITREAFRLYFDMLAARGILALHISNRYLRLEPVVANLAEEARDDLAVGERRVVVGDLAQTRRGGVGVQQAGGQRRLEQHRALHRLDLAAVQARQRTFGGVTAHRLGAGEFAGIAHGAVPGIALHLAALAGNRRD